VFSDIILYIFFKINKIESNLAYQFNKQTKMSQFNKDFDELLYLTNNKCQLVNHLRKNYKENVHYIIDNSKVKGKKIHGGHNKKCFFLTEEAFELFKNTYNLRNRYIVDSTDKVKYINIGMCVETQTIGFIENSYKNSLKVKRQYSIGKYRVDLYFTDYKLVVECDENNHERRDPVEEKTREEYILSLGNKMIRYNPNEEGFDLSNVLSKINAILFCK